MSRDTYYAAGIVVTEKFHLTNVNAFVNVTGMTLD